ncbi:MAG TPA: T9SS type A sorting domain-containing protein, partial [Anaeromyxobacteraceae bacterium]|nr:T9SS type A sorting domain-containing protein [Anaeromyxobacteraceae bacterium]
LGPRAVHLPPGASLTRTLTQRVPAAAPAGTYTYALHAGTFGGAVLASSAFTFTKAGSAPAAGAEDEWTVGGWSEAAASASEAGSLALGAPVPNPARGAVTISFALPEAADVRLSVYDVLGREVAILVDGTREAGAHAVTLDAGALAAGLYVYRLQAGAEARSGHLTVTR